MIIYGPFITRPRTAGDRDLCLTSAWPEGVKLKVTGSVGSCWMLLKPGCSHGELASWVLLTA